MNSVNRLAKPPGFFKTYINGHLRAFKEGMLMPWARPLKTIMTLITLAICFYIPLLLWTVWMNYQELNESWSQQGSIAIFLKNSATSKESLAFVQSIEARDWVQSVEIINKTSVQEELKTDQQLAAVVDLVELQELPDQVLIHPYSHADSELAKTFVEEVSAHSQVNYVSYDEKWFSQLNAVTNTLLQLSRLSVVVFFLIVMVFLGHIIGNEISIHKRELELLELIGASHSQLRRRFLYLGSLFGFLAGLIAIVFLVVSLWWLEVPLKNLAQTYAADLSLQSLSAFQAFLVLCVSVIVTWLAARISLSAQNKVIE